VNKISVTNTWTEIVPDSTVLTIQNVGNNHMRVYVDRAATGAPVDPDSGYFITSITQSNTDSNLTLDDITDPVFVYSRNGTTAVY